MFSERYYPARRKYDPDVTTVRWFLQVESDDRKRRDGKEKQASERLSKVLLSDKILDDNFCNNVLPKLIDNYSSLVEENTEKYQKERKELDDYELWHCAPEIWSYLI